MMPRTVPTELLRALRPAFGNDWRRLSLTAIALLCLIVGCAPLQSAVPVPEQPGVRQLASAPAPATSPDSTQTARVYPPISLPRDDAPHDNLTEWWYYTGHLQAQDGRRYGFEFVIFQTVRGDYPVLYLAQTAVTDQARGSFQHENRLSQGSQIGPTDRVDLAVEDWRLQGPSAAASTIQASISGYDLQLGLDSKKPPILHDDDGLVSFGPSGDSYYYSYTRLAVQGTLVDHGEPIAVTGQAWFDHQWGDFLVLGGGWDWFSVRLDDGAELMLNELRDDQGRVVGVWGTYVAPDGSYRSLNAADFTIRPKSSWTSPVTGGVYPMGWAISLGSPAYELSVNPVLPDQELASNGSGPTYWEGAADVVGSRAGQPVSGKGYVELTGYAKN